MKGRTGVGALVLSALACASLGRTAAPSDGVAAAPAREPAPTSSLPDRAEPAASPPGPADPVVVQASASRGSAGWSLRASAGSTALDQLPDDLLGAYALAVAAAPPSCHMTTSLLAAIGQVESGNLADRQIDARHRVRPAVLGPVLDGAPYAAVRDTDGGRWDGDVFWDRAVGPLQLLPSTWRAAGVDMDADGVRDPQDVYDAAGAAMVYLCAADRDLATSAGLRRAVLSYNHSGAYLDAVLGWKAVFDRSPGGFASTAWAPPAVPTPTTVRTRTGTRIRPHASAGTPVAVVRGPLDPATDPATDPTPDPTPEPTPDPTTGPTADPAAAPTPDPTTGPTTGPSSDPVPVPSGPTVPATPPEPLPSCALPVSEPGVPGTTPTPVPSPSASAGGPAASGPAATAPAAPPASAAPEPRPSQADSPSQPTDPAPAAAPTCQPPVGYELDPLTGEPAPVTPTP